MGINVPGLFAFLTLIKPRPSQPILPHLIVPSINSINWSSLRSKGVDGIIIDKDNCITRPDQDGLADSLRSTWQDLLRVFGPGRVLIVSNSAGSNKDGLLLGAESVSSKLGVPVLVHRSPKPSFSCTRDTLAYFTPRRTTYSPPSFLKKLTKRLKREEQGAVIWPFRSREDAEWRDGLRRDGLRLAVIGDRYTTDIVLASRLRSLSLPSSSSTSTSTLPEEEERRIETVSILTTELHMKEKIGTTLMRSIENFVLRRRIKQFPLYGSEWKDCLYPTTTVTKEAVPRRTEEGYGKLPLVIRIVANIGNRLEPLYRVWQPSPVTSNATRWTPTSKWRETFATLSTETGNGIEAVETRIKGWERRFGLEGIWKRAARRVASQR